MDLPSLSVIIPCYNGLPYVLEAVQSVLDQADDGVECIVVDDGSRDNSAEALIGRFGSRILLIRQENAGAAAARNRGYQEARGELVLWLDADDKLMADTLSHRREQFRLDPALEMLVGQNQIVDIDTGQTEISPLPPCDKNYLLQDLLARKNLPHSNILTFRRASLPKVGLYDSSLTIGEEFGFWIRCWAKLKWRFVEKIYSMQRTGSYESLSRAKGKVFFYEQVGVALRKNRKYVRQLTGSDKIWRSAYSRFAADFSLIHLKRENRKEALRWGLIAVAMAPLGAESRAYKYVFEACCPANVHRWARSFAVRIGLARPLEQG